MATTQSRHKNTNDRSKPAAEALEDAKDISQDLVEYVTDYARQNPGYAALWCIGVGFVLGWKLKPW